MCVNDFKLEYEYGILTFNTWWVGSVSTCLVLFVFVIEQFFKIKRQVGTVWSSGF